MLRNNADARRCSYFELGLPVEKEYNNIILQLLQLANSFQTQMGLLQTKEEDYFLEPMARMERQPHLFYKRSTLLRSMPQNSSLFRGCALKSSLLQGTCSCYFLLSDLSLISTMSICSQSLPADVVVTHSFPLRWGRNECVTNEPQRTSAGRLYVHMPVPAGVQLVRTAQRNVFFRTSFRAEQSVIGTHGTGHSTLQSLLEARGSSSGLQEALGTRMGTGYMFIRIHLLVQVIA